MDTAQSRAVLAILCMIESGIQQLKMLLSVDAIDSHVMSASQRPSAEPSHLTEDEEKRLEQQLEEERAELLAFEERRAEVMWQPPPNAIPGLPFWGEDE